MNRTAPVPPARVALTPVLVFLVISFAGAWLVMLPAWLSGDGLASSAATPGMIAMMFVPALAALVIGRFVQHRRGKALWVHLGAGVPRPRGDTFRAVGWSILITGAVVIGGWMLAGLMGFLQLDLDRSQAHNILVEAIGEDLPLPMPALALLQLGSLPLGILITAIATTGEELGWRGWLLPALLPLGRVRALVISGAIWGLWHSPAILLGYNFQQPNLFGVGLMVVGCVLAGVIFGWLRLQSGSVWPAVFAHATFNSLATYQLYLVDEDYDPLTVGPLSITGWVAMFVAIVFIWARSRRSTKRMDPALK